MNNYDIAPSGSVQRARRLRRDATGPEKLMCRRLREAFPDAKFRRQSPVGPYVADFLSFRHKLVIELDGGQHALQTERDAARTAFLQNQGYQVMRFWNNEVAQNADGVLQTIGSALHPHPGPFPVGEGE
jgi:very-short-patch-repair endonuclease